MSELTTATTQARLTLRHVLLGIIAIICLAGVYYAGSLSSASTTLASDSSGQTNLETASRTDDIRIMPVNVTTAKYVESVKQTRTFTGTIRAKSRSQLGFELSGKIKEVFVDEGDTISLGSPIAELDTETLAAQKNAILARLEQARNVLAELESGPRLQTINAARASRDAARSQSEMAKTNLLRRESLRNSGAISSEEFDRASFGLRTAEANLKAADEQLSELEAGTRQEKIDAQVSLVKQLDASLDEIDVAIRKSTLLAPFNGTITQRHLDPGSIAQASAPVVRLVDEQNLEAWIGLPVTAVAKLEVGDRTKIEIDGQPYQASLIAKIRELDSMTRTQTVVFKLDTTETHAVVSGQLCEIQIENDSQASGFWVPTTSLAKGVRGLWSVMVLKPMMKSGESRVEKSDVEIIHTESDRVLVRGTLNEGDRIVSDGVHRISVGQIVEASDNQNSTN
jgi:RND family efflux transporter MFP subunit